MPRWISVFSVDDIENGQHRVVDIDDTEVVIFKVDNDFFVLSGDDALTYPIMSLGGHGIISVMSNIFPREMKNIVWQCLTNNFEAAKQSHYKYLLRIAQYVVSDI
jgi:4-hydroxy-tetrahydrodipicolinate synthase